MNSKSPTPVVTIHPASAEPARKQIADQIRSAIVEGSLRIGEELPSVRRLAIDVGVHFNTIAEAYRQLAGEGWLDIAHGRATRVQLRADAAPACPQVEEDFRQRVRHLVTEMRAAGMVPDRIRELMLTVVEGAK